MVIESNLNEKLGLDKPLPVQYFVFLGHLLTGDPGVSVVNGAPITTIITEAGPKTLALGISAAILTYTIAIPLGVIAAARRNGMFDQGTRFLAVLGDGHPELLPGGAADPALRRRAALASRGRPRRARTTWSCPPSCSASRRSRSTCG